MLSLNTNKNSYDLSQTFIYTERQKKLATSRATLTKIHHIKINYIWFIQISYTATVHFYWARLKT